MPTPINGDQLRKLATMLRQAADDRDSQHIRKCAQAIRASAGLDTLRRKLTLLLV